MHVVAAGPSIMVNTTGGDLFVPDDGGVPNNVRLIQGAVLVTSSQTLDDFVWEDVVFVGTRIRYKGGPLTLKNVRFVDCTFDVPSSKGAPVLNYAMTGAPELTVGAATPETKGRAGE
jgi:hypothetical protein